MLDGRLYITSNEDAPRFRVFKTTCAAPERSNWQEIIPETDAVIEGRATIIAKKLFVHSIKNARSQLSLFDLDGKLVAEVAMPALGSIFDLGGNWNSDTGFFGFISYAVPTTVFEVNLNGQTTEWARVESGIDPKSLSSGTALVHLQRRNTRANVRREQKRSGKKWPQSHVAFGLWRLQCWPHAIFQSQRNVAAAGARRRLC